MTDPFFPLLPGLMVSPELKGFQAGTIRLINTTYLLRNNSLYKSSDVVETVIMGSHTSGHFGNALVKDQQGSLWVSEPLFNRGKKSCVKTN